jgi:hypothetical protein
MNEMINKNLSRLQFILFIGSLVGFIFAFYYGWVLKISAISFILSMILLEYNMVEPMFIYRKTRKTKPDFDMSAFNMPKVDE